jgi:hypothetical protein
MRTRGLHGAGQLGAVVPLTAFNLREGRQDRPARAGDVPRHGLGLHFKPKAAAPLLIGRNPVIGDEAAH